MFLIPIIVSLIVITVVYIDSYLIAEPIEDSYEENAIVEIEENVQLHNDTIKNKDLDIKEISEN